MTAAAIAYVPLAAVPPPPVRLEAPGKALTPHQERVARLVARGMSNKAIAAEIGVSEVAVKTQVSQALERIGLIDRVGLTLWVIRERLAIPVD